MITSKAALFLFATLALPVPAPSQATRPAQIVLIRHGEKPADPADPHLSKAGIKRSERLVGFVMGDAAINRFGPPVAIYATQTTKHDDGQRTQETVAPLARALKVAVQTPALGKDYATAAKQILTNPAYAGKTVVICWNHEEIPQLAAALGVTPEPPKWRGSVFDQVYLISYHDGRAKLTIGRYE